MLAQWDRYENLTMNGTMCGVHIKSRPSRGGVMDGIYYRNIRAHNVRQLFVRTAALSSHTNLSPAVVTYFPTLVTKHY